MGRINELYKTTELILNALNESHSTTDDRTKVITKVNDLLEKRREMIKQMKPPYTKEEEQIGVKIIKLDEMIKEKMDYIYVAIQNDLKQIKHKKDSNIAYINPYKNMKTVDGMYLDNKL